MELEIRAEIRGRDAHIWWRDGVVGGDTEMLARVGILPGRHPTFGNPAGLVRLVEQQLGRRVHISYVDPWPETPPLVDLEAPVERREPSLNVDDPDGLAV